MNEPKPVKDESGGPKKGEPAGVVVKLAKLARWHSKDMLYGRYFLTLPTEITDGLGWNVGDDLDLEFTELCETWGETQGCVIRNLTKEREDVLTVEKENVPQSDN